MTLTVAQKAAAEATDRYVVVRGAPGCGKSTVLAARAAHLIKQGVEPRRILVLCFTRSGASSIRAKVQEATGQEPQCDTFDRYALGLLTEAGAMEGLTVATDLEHETAIRGLYEGGTRLRKGEACGISALRKAITDYQSGKRDVGGLEAQTIATLSVRLNELGRKPLWELVPEALGYLDVETEITFEHVLVDERQDLTPNEEQMAVMTTQGVGSVFAVGDPAQAIMQFRGAVADAFNGLDPKQYALVESFRFGPEIAEAVNVVGRRLGVPDVVGVGPKGWADVDDALPVLPEDEDEYPVDTLVLAPTNIACQTLVPFIEAESRRSPYGPCCAMHVRRDEMMDPVNHSDPFGTAEEAGAIAVSTVHFARGREFKKVIVTGLANPTHPLDFRLAYVALSRAMRSLVVVEP